MKFSAVIGSFFLAIALAFSGQSMAVPKPELYNDGLTKPESQRHERPNENYQTARVLFCYAGSLVDPESGELIDLFVLCENAIEADWDIA